MKKLVRNLITNMCAILPEQVIPKIEKADCKAISFDIFDTLIKRNVPTPKDVFFLLEKQYQRKFGSDRKISRLRGEAEKQAVQQTGRRDVNLQEIYLNRDFLIRRIFPSKLLQCPFCIVTVWAIR